MEARGPWRCWSAHDGGATPVACHRGTLMSSRGPCDDTAVRLAVGQRPCAPSARKWVLAATILGSTMAFVDGTLVNVSLPAIQSRLGASGTGAQWIVEAYALFLS